MQPLIAGLGAPELLILLAVVVLLFGASKLPDLARGSGQALRIFKAETHELKAENDPIAGPVEGPVVAPIAEQVRESPVRRTDDVV